MQKIDQIIKIIQALSNQDTITPESMIFAEKIIDSLGIIHLVCELERHFSVKIKPIEATLDDFASPNAILNLLARLKA